VAVLLALPLGHFDYPDAVFVWNLISMLALACGMKIVANTLALPWTALAPALALLALCHPVYGNLYMCQLNLLLVLLVTTAWALEQSGRSHRAGLIIGAAAAVKLFPIYLSVFYLARGRIWPLGAALLSFLALNFLAACVLGLDCYRDYVQIVIPEQAPFWGCGYNLSIAGFWHKLFNPLTENGLVAPLWLSPNLARWGTLVSDLAVTAIAAVLARRAETPFQRGMAFGTTVTAMLLVSPVTWDVSLPLLMVPIALILRGTEPPAARWIPTALVLILAIAWVPQKTLTMLALAGRSPGACSWQFMLGAPTRKFYGLLGIFALGLASFRAGGKN
jgi:alpha-1,2-mannosyltransferase